MMITNMALPVECYVIQPIKSCLFAKKKLQNSVYSKVLRAFFCFRPFRNVQVLILNEIFHD